MGDNWFAVDKAEHFAACFLIVLFCACTIRCFLLPGRITDRIAILIGCIVSLTIGAAKEFGDEMQFWASDGASIKDAVADALGAATASAFLFLVFKSRTIKAKQRVSFIYEHDDLQPHKIPPV